MFAQPTVIILGAGASAQFGFPLGAQLISDITRVLGDLGSYGTIQNPLLSIGAQNAIDFIKRPGQAFVSYLNSSISKFATPENFRVEQIKDFADDIMIQDFDTIDRFMRDNPRHVYVGKLLLAHHILLNMYRRRDGGSRIYLRNFSQPRYGGMRNWYRLLVHYMREGADSADELTRNQLTILTFNYDLSLELALEHMLPNTEVHAGADYRNVVRIFHLNGAPNRDSLVSKMSDVGKFLLEQAQTMHIIDEEVSSEVHEQRAKSVSALANAERIFVLGFHFDPSNISILKLDEITAPKRIFCLNYSGDLGVRRRILNLGIPEENVLSGEVGDELSVDRALAQGFLEQ